MKSKIKVGLADDHPIFRRGLHQIISQETELDLIWEAENGQVVLDLIRQNVPDVLILDLDMPVLDGVKTARIISDEYPQVELVFLTMHKDSQVFESMKSFGVRGYILKDSAMQEVVTCIRQVSAGQTYLTPELTEHLLLGSDSEPYTNQKSFLLSNLTISEKRILLMVAESKSSKEIAATLFLSPRTIDNHRFNICKKLHLNGNHALFKFAIQHKNEIVKLLNE